MLLGTGVFLAAADRHDPDHAAGRELIEEQSGPLVTTAMVVAETGWLIDRQVGPATEAAFYRGIAPGTITVEALTATDWARIAELVDAYADLPLGGTDASLVAVAERLALTQVATLDHRHLRVLRPHHVDAFELLPSPASNVRQTLAIPSGGPATCPLTGTSSSSCSGLNDGSLRARSRRFLKSLPSCLFVWSLALVVAFGSVLVPHPVIRVVGGAGYGTQRSKNDRPTSTARC